jgi:hypothetical protein
MNTNFLSCEFKKKRWNTTEKASENVEVAPEASSSSIAPAPSVEMGYEPVATPSEAPTASTSGAGVQEPIMEVATPGTQFLPSSHLNSHPTGPVLHAPVTPMVYQQHPLGVVPINGLEYPTGPEGNETPESHHHAVQAIQQQLQQQLLQHRVPLHHGQLQRVPMMPLMPHLGSHGPTAEPSSYLPPAIPHAAHGPIRGLPYMTPHAVPHTLPGGPMPSEIGDWQPAPSNN